MVVLGGSKFLGKKKIREMGVSIDVSSVPNRFVVEYVPNLH